MDIKIYTTPGCKYCTQLKELIVRADLEYEEFLVNTPELKENFKSKYPEASTFPFVIIDEEVVGGLVETAKMFVVNGLVKSRK
jgi:glutaredoxin